LIDDAVEAATPGVSKTTSLLNLPLNVLTAVIIGVVAVCCLVLTVLAYFVRREFGYVTCCQLNHARISLREVEQADMIAGKGTASSVRTSRSADTIADSRCLSVLSTSARSLPLDSGSNSSGSVSPALLLVPLCKVMADV
jgi:hypothetical protein